MRVVSAVATCRMVRAVGSRLRTPLCIARDIGSIRNPKVASLAADSLQCWLFTPIPTFPLEGEGGVVSEPLAVSMF